jgi:hypothetical protein
MYIFIWFYEICLWMFFHVFNYKQVNRILVLLFHLMDQPLLFFLFFITLSKLMFVNFFTLLQIFVDSPLKKLHRHFMYISKHANVYAYNLASHMYENVSGNLWKQSRGFCFFRRKTNDKQGLISIQIIFSLILT